MTAWDYIIKDIGNPIGLDTTAINTTIATTVTQLLNNNPNCIVLLMINTGANDCNVWTDETVSSTKGIRLAATGGNMVWYVKNHGLLPTFQWWGVGVGGSTTISVQRLNLL